MKTIKDFKQNEIFNEDLSPIDCRLNQTPGVRSLNSLKTVGIFILKLYLIIFVIVFIFTLLPEMPQIVISTFTISLIFIIFFWFIFTLFSNYGVVGEKWRKDKFEKWFRMWRLKSLVEYLESKNLSNFDIIDTEKIILENKILDKNVAIDYIVNKFAGARIIVGSPIGSQDKFIYQEESHFFSFETINNNFLDANTTISFCGDQREQRLDSGWNSKIDMKQTVDSADENNYKVKEIMTKINNLITKNRNLKGFIIIKENKIKINLLDSFDNIQKTGRYPHTKFLKNNSNPNFTFDGVEELIKIFL